VLIIFTGQPGRGKEHEIMVDVRASVFLCLVVLMVAGVAVAQPLAETARYTALPETWAETKVVKEQAGWLVKAFLDPAAVIKEEPDRFMTVLGKTPFDLKALSQQDAPALRAQLAAVILDLAKYDPGFEAVLTVARTSATDRFLAMQSAALLADTAKKYIAQYPRIADPARDILIEDVRQGRDEVKYVAIKGLASCGNASGSKAVTEALVGQLSNKNEAVVEEAAKALGGLGDMGAVKPLMQTFMSIQEDTLPTEEDQADQGKSVQGTPGPPLNEARYQIAIAVGNLTGIDRGLTGQNRYKADVIAKYDDLLTWWDQNKNKYL
jgi:hypothetical protein